MVTEVRSDRAIDEFATNVGEWLLTQRFGSITPVAFRHRMWEPGPDYGDAEPHVVIELVVEDPPAPANNGTPLSRDDGEWAKSLLWPQAEMDAVRTTALEYARGIGIPEGIAARWPVDVQFFACSEAETCGFAPLDG